VHLDADAAEVVDAAERAACLAAMRLAVERAREIARPRAADGTALCSLLRRGRELIAARLAASEQRRFAEEAVNGVLRFALEHGGDGDPLPGVLAHAVGALRVGRLTYVEKDVADRCLRVAAAAASPGLVPLSQDASMPFPVERELAAEPRIVRRGDASNEEFLLLELLGVAACAVAPVRAIAQQKRGYVCADFGAAGRAPEPGVERCVGLIADQASLLVRIEQLAREKERLALQDPLTGVATRRRMMDRLEFLLHQTQRTGHPVSVLMLEVDHLARVNQTLGSKIGDRWLQEVAAVLASSVRKTDLVARYTGGVFAVILPSCAIEGARSLAEELRRTVFERGAQNRDLYGGMVVSVSVGAAANAEGDTPPALLARADVALQAATRGGTNRVEVAA
jgi:diguanylate cyclase (GGDEF)-like protein